jgi:hypothetical protein
VLKGRKSYSQLNQAEGSLLPERTPAISRREALIEIMCAGPTLAATLAALAAPPRAQAQGQDTSKGQSAPRATSELLESYALSAEDESLLDELEVATFRYFWDQSDPITGLVRDRFDVRAATDRRTAASIAATGFGLTAICIGDQRKLVPTGQARDRVIAALRFLGSEMPTHRGFFYHWADLHSGARIWDSEVSSIDTAILLCGVLTCREHYHASGDADLRPC